MTVFSKLDKTTLFGGIALLVVLMRYFRSFSKASLLHSPAAVGTAIEHTQNDLKEGGDQSKEYDFVIVGGGTASLVLANRLSESPNVTVLVLEAGQSGVALRLSRIPALFTRIMRTKYDWMYQTTSQPALNGRELHWTRTKLLGGCSSGNAMMFHYGAPEDYDEWAMQSGSAEWSYASMRRYFQKFERFVPHPQVPISTTERGTDGPVQTGYFGLFTRIGSAFLWACENIGIPQVDDVNTSKGSMGATRTPTYMDSKGRRVSTESAYLSKDVLARENLKVATGAQVTKIRFSVVDGVKRAVGVEFSSAKGGPVYFAKAKKEVLLSAGATNSPQILLLSGVGPSSELSKHNIPVVQDLPGVGQHLTDHTAININFRTLPGYTFAKDIRPTGIRGVFTIIKLIAQYRLYGSGILTMHSQECMAFTRTTDPKLFPPEEFTATDYEDTASGPGAPDLEIMVSPLGWRDHGFGKFVEGEVMSITPALLRPTSRGAITLRSADPFDKPVIDPRYLSTKHDMEFFKRAARISWRIGKAEPLSSILDHSDQTPELDYSLDKISDDALEGIIKSRLETLYHPTSTARMVPLSEGGVVDPQLRVYGIGGLRVIDASIMPTIVSGHTAGPVIAIAEKASDMIKGTWKESYP